MSIFKKSLLTTKQLSRNKVPLFISFRNESWWTDLKQGPPDPIFGVTEAFRVDTNPKKVLLGVGAYKTDEGKPFVLPSVRKAEQIICKQNLDHEYLVQSGFADFNNAAARLAFGEESCMLKNGQNLTFQTLSGTGALRLAAEFLGAFFPGCKVIYLPDPTWPVHKTLFPRAGVQVKYYRYYCSEKIEFDFCGACEDIKNMQDKSIILFHAIAHNPTGLDPNNEQWKELSKLCLEKKLFVIFDMAYQGKRLTNQYAPLCSRRRCVPLTGFASGDTDNDASAVRLFVEDGHNLVVAQSFSKNMGLYGQRIGACTFVTASKEEQDKLKSQMSIIIVPMYASPPLHGARIVHQILSNNSLKCQWQKDIKGMSERIKSARKMLVDGLKKAGSQHNWDHITKQTGMFSYTGLTGDHVKKLIKEHSVFLPSDGRISIASLGTKNVEYVANALHAVTK